MMADQMKSKKQGALRKTLMVWFLSISLLPLAFVSWFSYYQSEEILSNAVSNDLERSAYQGTVFINNWFDFRFIDSQNQASISSNVETLSSLIEGAAKTDKTIPQYVKSDDWAVR
jgi:two-component system, sensor histidine kinase and response regulator